MKINIIVHSALVKPLNWLTLGIVAGSGLFTLLLTPPTLAQLGNSDSIRLTPSGRPRPTQTPTSLVAGGDYEIKGDKLRQCLPQANTDKKKCTEVLAGYAQIVSYGTDLYRQGNITVAENIFRELTRAFPKEATPHLRLGAIMERQGNLDAAISEYRKTIELNPKHAVARNALGAVLARQGQVQEAINVWKEALAINPEYADALINLGIGLLQQGNKDEGMANLKKAKDILIKQGEVQKAKKVDDFIQQFASQST